VRSQNKVRFARAEQLW